MLVHNLVVTGSLTFPTALPISGSLLVSGSTTFNGTSTFSSPDLATDGLGNVNIFTTDAAAIGKGGSLSFGGGTTGGTSPYAFAKIEGVYNGSAAYDGTLIFSTNRAGTIAEKMRISNSGSVGIGTTVLGWDDTQITALQIRNASMYGYATGELGIVQNAQYQGGWKYISSGAASYQVSAGGTHAFYTAPSGNASASVTWTERFSISNAGSASFNNGNSLASAADAATITIKQPSTVATNGIYLERSGEQKGYYIYISSTSDSLTFRRNNAGTKADVMFLTRDGNVTINRPSSGATLLQLNGSDAYGDTSTINLCDGRSYIKSEILVTANGNTNISFGTYNGTSISERMRIVDDNVILMGTTSTSTTNSGGMIFRATNAAYGGVIIMNHSTTNNTSAGYVDCFYNTSYIGGIAQNGGSNVAFNTSSDYRLKEDLKDFDGLNLVSSLKVYDFKWKADDSRMYGVIAHEAQEVIPYIVSGDKDEMKENGKMKIQVVDYSKLTPILIKAIQEQQATIETLTTRITALEN